jgi:hypothetical protein
LTREDILFWDGKVGSGMRNTFITFEERVFFQVLFLDLYFWATLTRNDLALGWIWVGQRVNDMIPRLYVSQVTRREK